MNHLEIIKDRLTAKLQIQKANQSIQKAKSTMKPFYTNKEAVAEVARLEQEIKSLTGIEPKATKTFYTSKEAKAAIADLEARIEAITAAKAKSASPAPSTAKPTAAPVVKAAPINPAASNAIITGTISAKDFSSKPMVMLRSEFSTLSAADKGRFLKSGGTLTDPPQAAQPHSKGGKITRAGFAAMTPADRAAHCQSGKPIVD